LKRLKLPRTGPVDVLRQYAAVVTEAEKIADEISERLPDIKSGSLAVFGDIFGGRVDNIHTVRAARVGGTPEHIVVEFDDDETLEVWEPHGSTVDAQTFRIRRATKVRWEWFYYGRPKIPANRYYREHVVDGQIVTATTNVDWYTPVFDPTLERPAVELLGLSGS
jgi:hypothetical protein